MLQADTTKSIARVLSRRVEIVNKEVEIYLMGDSSCVAALFRPTITIKNILLRNVVLTVKQRIKEILDMIPLAKVQMCWIPGEENSSDPVSKLFMDPFKQTNTNLFRLGPTCFRTDDEKCVFLEITKNHETYKP